MKSFIFKVLIPVAIIGLGVAGMRYFKSKAKKAKHVEPTEQVLQVETMRVQTESLPMRVQASGSVQAAMQITLMPEVTGKIKWVSPNLIPGSRFSEGEVIARIDKSDYRLALEQQIGQVEQAKLNLTLEQSRGQVAREEWALIKGQNATSGEPADLALRKPHLEEARQMQASAQSSMARAALNLKKTVIRAPFDAMVLEKNVDIGQVVGPSSPLVSLMGTEELWVQVSVPVELLSAIRIPGLNATAEEGSLASVIQSVGDNKQIVRKGKVIRLLGRLDSRNRTATLLVSVPTPFDIGDSQLPLLAGAYVDVEIEGDVRQDVIRIPRGAHREGAFVWRVSKDNRLQRVAVQVAWKEPEYVILSSGIAAGDEIVTSPISFPLEGMPVVRVKGHNDISSKPSGKDHASSDSAVSSASTPAPLEK
ncbi:MAG: efflux RND transporter periplasmic adaptor subunit [Deltaproteobacteria bacterium]|nr:efflux RND transporter periplasmic adaptor subunit [Deltaproteobacteria bacterium]